jgi:hypothetical protein
MSEGKPVGFDYAGLVMDALRGVVRQVLRKVASDGLVGEQHFYISFRTTAPDVDLPAHLHAQFPQEMTIVLQHQFWGLSVEDAAFSVQLRFGGRLERLRIPFAALVAFADPSVPFGLRFEPADETDAAEPPPPSPADAEAPAATERGGPNVVAFRSGRKKAGKKRIDP